MSETFNIDKCDIFIAVDIQNDFCPGGALGVPNGDQVVPVINRLAKWFPHIVLTQDWHPTGHLSFASSHPAMKPYDFIEAPYGTQILWPDHCVQGTRGANLRSDLDIGKAELILRKGYHPTIDSYSAFYENDRTTPTGLGGYLRERGFRRVFVAGLAFDFCVRYSAEDAHREGFETIVFEDACRSIDIDGSAQATRDLFKERGIGCVPSSTMTAAAVG